ncbi:MAG: PD-(D/E)XK nuclease family protein [Bacilli bacterium]|nr:PD-(D/E)XK nuclease family protein [Bacilli bacterium]
MRKTNEELEKIKKELNCDKLWSWSRINTYMTDPYEYMLKYILHVPEDRNDSIYGISGNYAHNLMEDFYRNELNHESMLDTYEEKLFEFNTMGLMYDRSDNEKNEKIAKKYEECMKHYFLNHKRVTDKPIIEPFILIKIGNQYFQGYIDFLNVEVRNGRKKIIITDWKTSSIYKGQKLVNNSGQLLLYGEGIHQKNNTPYEDIIIRFNFMKYVNVTYTQKKGDIKIRQIERNTIGENLQSNAKMWLKHFEYDENQIDIFLAQMIDINGIECLPDEVKEKFSIDDCYVEIELNEDIINEHKNKIINVITEIVKKETEFAKTKDKNIFWKDVTKENSYYHANLCGYSANIHMPYKKYLEELDFQNGIKTIEDQEIADILDFLDDLL